MHRIFIFYRKHVDFLELPNEVIFTFIKNNSMALLNKMNILLSINYDISNELYLKHAFVFTALPLIKKNLFCYDNNTNQKGNVNAQIFHLIE